MSISLEQFKSVEMKIGLVLSAERVAGTDKLLRLSVDFGEETPRQVVSGIADRVEPESLVGKKFPFVTNLEPRVIRELESQAMILAVGSGDAFSLLTPASDVAPGSALR